MNSPATKYGHSATLDYTPTQDEFHQFHSIDRHLYSTLVFKLHHHPTRSLHVLAFLLSQERRSRRSIIAKIADKPLDTLHEIVLRADTCLRCIMDPTPVDYSFHEIRQFLRSDIVNVLNTVCLPAVSDIMQKAMRGLARRRKRGGGRWPEGRTMFMTFSKGYPVEEWEVMEYLRINYGDIVESVHMAAPTETEPQPLNAHIVLRSPEYVNELLRGDLRSSLQFSIRGKDARLRKYDHDRRVNYRQAGKK